MTFIQHWRFTALGSLRGEACSMGLSGAGTITTPVAGFGNFTTLTNVCTAARAPWVTFLGQLASYFGTTAKWTDLKVQEWDTTGQISGAAQVPFTSPVGGTGTVHLPDFLAVVVTLQTDIPRRLARGRLYVPMLSAVACSQGQLTSTDTQTINNSTQTLINALNVDTTLEGAWTGFRCVIASAAGAGQNTHISRVRTNSLIDTQRRRQNTTPAAFQSVANITP